MERVGSSNVLIITHGEAVRALLGSLLGQVVNKDKTLNEYEKSKVVMGPSLIGIASFRQCSSTILTWSIMQAEPTYAAY